MKTITILLSSALCLPIGALAQAKSTTRDLTSAKSPAFFPELIFTAIPGAPALSSPQLITGESHPLISEGMGWASPAFFDINNDGNKDLLIGEYGSGLEKWGASVGSFVRVYENEGSPEQPRFSGSYSYLAPIAEESNGTPMSIFTFCCLGFTPRIVDLDNDGYQDIATGQYNPGEVTWFRGSESGFHSGVKLPQFGQDLIAGKALDVTLPRTDPLSFDYWNYSSAAFGDFDGKGLQDMIIGGSALKISKNIGSKTSPKFGKRELLLDISGKPLNINDRLADYVPGAMEPYYGYNMVPTVVDWNQDGLPDLLVTNSYFFKNSRTVTFFEAVRTREGLRFKEGIDLFAAKNGGKALPGAWPHIAVADWNNDGVMDLIIGTSVAVIDNKFNFNLSWDWEYETGIAKKHTAYNSERDTRRIEEQMRRADSTQKALGLSDAQMKEKGFVSRSFLFKEYYGKEEYKKLAHHGYVYVMLGMKK